MPPEPLILGFDTSAAHCAVALVGGGETLALRVEPMARGQAERLMPLIGECLADGGLSWGDLAAIGVGSGPGNFTGIRISIAAARGLALSLGIPAVGVNTFEAVSLGRKRPHWAVTDARRDMVFARFQATAPGVPLQLSLTELAALKGAVFHRNDLPAEDFVHNIASIAAQSFKTPQPRPAPLYVRPPDAAPSAAGAPAILT